LDRQRFTFVGHEIGRTSAIAAAATVAIATLVLHGTSARGLCRYGCAEFWAAFALDYAGLHPD